MEDYFDNAWKIHLNQKAVNAVIKGISYHVTNKMKNFPWMSLLIFLG